MPAEYENNIHSKPRQLIKNSFQIKQKDNTTKLSNIQNKYRDAVIYTSHKAINKKISNFFKAICGSK